MLIDGTGKSYVQVHQEFSEHSRRMVETATNELEKEYHRHLVVDRPFFDAPVFDADDAFDVYIRMSVFKQSSTLTFTRKVPLFDVCVFTPELGRSQCSLWITSPNMPTDGMLKGKSGWSTFWEAVPSSDWKTLRGQLTGLIQSKIESRELKL